jgi:hypothetical protein
MPRGGLPGRDGIAQDHVPVRDRLSGDLGDAFGAVAVRAQIAQATSVSRRIGRWRVDCRKDGGLTDVRSFTDLLDRTVNFCPNC